MVNAPGPWEAFVPVQVAAVDAEHVLAVGRRLFVQLAWTPRHEDRALGVTVRRTRRDQHLVAALEAASWVIPSKLTISGVMSAWMVTEPALPEQLFGPVPAMLSP